MNIFHAGFIGLTQDWLHDFFSKITDHSELNLTTKKEFVNFADNLERLNLEFHTALPSLLTIIQFTTFPLSIVIKLIIFPYLVLLNYKIFPKLLSFSFRSTDSIKN